MKTSQIVFKERGTTLTVPGFGTLQEGSITPQLHAAVIAAHPNLKDQFEVIEVEAQVVKATEVKK